MPPREIKDLDRNPRGIIRYTIHSTTRDMIDQVSLAIPSIILVTKSFPPFKRYKVILMTSPFSWPRPLPSVLVMPPYATQEYQEKPKLLALFWCCRCARILQRRDFFLGQTYHSIYLHSSNIQCLQPIINPCINRKTRPSQPVNFLCTPPPCSHMRNATANQRQRSKHNPIPPYTLVNLHHHS